MLRLKTGNIDSKKIIVPEILIYIFLQFHIF